MALTFPFGIELDVRGYEIDSWGHTNNAVYVQWLEEARWQVARAGGLPFESEGVLAVVRALELSYEAETRLGDRVRVSVWPRKVGNTSMTFGAEIRIIGAPEAERVGSLALTATMVLACVQPGAGKAKVPAAWAAIFPAADPGPKLPD